MTTTTPQVLSDRLRELCFSEELFSSEDTIKLKTVVEQERAVLEAEYNAKFRARIKKMITRVTIDKIIGGTPSAAATGGAL